MTNEIAPPRWADALLRALLRPADQESISGDLLEEYLVVRQPALGRLGADLWYIRQVISMLWRLVWPAAIPLIPQAVFLAVTVFRPGHHAPHPARETPSLWLSVTFNIFWYGSIVGAPGVSLFDGAIYFFAAYFGVERTRLIRTGIVTAAASSLLGFAALYAAAAIVTPGLAMALLTNPALFLIPSVHLLIVLAYASCVGMLAGILSRWVPIPPLPRMALPRDHGAAADYHDAGPARCHFALRLRRSYRNRFERMSIDELKQFIEQMRERGEDVSAFETDPRERLVRFLEEFGRRTFGSTGTLESLTLLEDTSDSTRRGGRYLAAFANGSKMIWSVALGADGALSFDGQRSASSW